MTSSDEIFPHIAIIHDLEDTLTQDTDPATHLTAFTLGSSWAMRTAVRALLLHDGRIALQSMPCRQVTKLPGGGAKAGESNIRTVERELGEEVGLRPGTLRPLGSVIELRKEWGLIQVSFCFQGILDSLDDSHMPTEEDSRLVWAQDAADAIGMLKESEGSPDNAYDRQFAIARDISVVDYYMNNPQLHQ